MNALIELFAGHTTSKKFTTKNCSFKLRTLTTDELADVLRRTDLVALSDLTKLVVTRKLTLAYALESINDVDVMAIPEVQELRKSKGNDNLTKFDLLAEILGKFDDITIRTLYGFYEELQSDHEKGLEALKKA